MASNDRLLWVGRDLREGNCEKGKEEVSGSGGEVELVLSSV